MKQIISLLIYVSICIITGFSFSIQLAKYADQKNSGQQSQIDILLLSGLVLAFLTAMKELLEALNKIHEAFKNDKLAYFKSRRKEGKIEIEIDDQSPNKSICAILFKHSVLEEKKRAIGDEVIGYQFFTDIQNNFYLHGRVRGRKALNHVTFEVYSDLPIISRAIAKYLDVKCMNENGEKLNFSIKNIGTSIHRFDIKIDLGRQYHNGEEFRVICNYTVPYCLAAEGDEYLSSSANYCIIKEHFFELKFKHLIPDTAVSKVLDNKNEFETIITPIGDKKNIFVTKTLNLRNQSKIQISFFR